MSQRAVNYCRVSTQEQAEDDRVSLEDQRKSFEEYCQRQGYTVVAPAFVDVFSGRRDDRQEYQKMLAFLRAGGADVVVVKFLDRFGRQPKTILRHIWSLQDVGVRVEATDEDLSHELITLVRAGLAGEEVKRTSERVRSALKRRVERGQRVGPLTVGLTTDGEGRPVVDKAWAPLVRRLFVLYVRGDETRPQGYGYRALVEYLNTRGLLTRQGRYWSPSTVKFVLKDRALLGELTQAGVSWQVPLCVVCPGLFQLAQERMAQRDLAREGAARLPGSGQLLSGLLFCAQCGKRMQVYGSFRRYYRQKDGEWGRSRDYYYTCGSKQDFGLCRHNSIAVRRADAAVLRQLRQTRDEGTVRARLQAEISQGEQEQAALDQRRQELRRALASLDSRVAAQIGYRERGLIDDQQLEVVARELRAQRQAVAAEVVELDRRERELLAQRQSPAEVEARMDRFLIGAEEEEPDLAEQRAKLAEIVERIDWDGQKLEIDFRL